MRQETKDPARGLPGQTGALEPPDPQAHHPQNPAQPPLAAVDEGKTGQQVRTAEQAEPARNQLCASASAVRTSVVYARTADACVWGAYIGEDQ